MIYFIFITGESAEMLFRHPTDDKVETFLDESPTAPKKNYEMKKIDFVTLNDGKGYRSMTPFTIFRLYLK